MARRWLEESGRLFEGTDFGYSRGSAGRLSCLLIARMMFLEGSRDRRKRQYHDSEQRDSDRR